MSGPKISGLPFVDPAAFTLPQAREHGHFSEGQDRKTAADREDGPTSSRNSAVNLFGVRNCQSFAKISLRCEITIDP